MLYRGPGLGEWKEPYNIPSRTEKKIQLASYLAGTPT